MPIASSSISIGYEVLCLALTLAKTFGTYRKQRRTGMKTPLSKLLLREGESVAFNLVLPSFIQDTCQYRIFVLCVSRAAMRRGSSKVADIT